ncbi:nucleotide-binding universal stress UspA family protein [Thermoflavifilum aggregans]|uniref:Nucleotide-binding universal stress UspA family protein n=1 Tax=Thermoflavifilum aggregans TaxID=454188 RepID=A0A2M9CXV1_9BACT|nr:universal stress protein [Thermoflavifilum aggregans]PJJ76744.1 nucleotide-binding universal stress UspA family protein [Thermoflavifilum aggregans]
MVTILAPTDFSLNARHATTYAAKLIAHQFHNDGKLILLHVFEAPSAISEYELNMLHFDTMKTYIRERLEERKNELKEEVDRHLHIECVATNEGLLEHVRRLCHHYQVDFVVIGLTGAGMGNIFMGSHTVEIAQHAGYPVITVPPRAEFPGERNIRKIVFAYDFSAGQPGGEGLASPEAHPHFHAFARIRKVVQLLGVELLVMHVGHPKKEEDAQMETQQRFLQEYFSGLQVSFHRISSRHVVSGIKDFVRDQQADMILLIPQQQRWPGSLLKMKHTRAVLFRSTVPVLTIPA